MPLSRAACWGSVSCVPLWPRIVAVGGPKKGARALCYHTVIQSRVLHLGVLGLDGGASRRS